MKCQAKSKLHIRSLNSQVKRRNHRNHYNWNLLNCVWICDVLWCAFVHSDSETKKYSKLDKLNAGFAVYSSGLNPDVIWNVPYIQWQARRALHPRSVTFFIYILICWFSYVFIYKINPDFKAWAITPQPLNFLTSNFLPMWKMTCQSLAGRSTDPKWQESLNLRKHHEYYVATFATYYDFCRLLQIQAVSII